MEQPVDGFAEARPGQLTCLDPGCAQRHRHQPGLRCVGCGRRTKHRPKPDLYAQLGYPATAVPPRPSAPPTFPPGTRPAMPSSAPPLGGREILSRTLYGGFWTVVAVVSGYVALARLSDGEFGAFLLGSAVAAAAGLYAGYIFRGGRFRFLVY